MAVPWNPFAPDGMGRREPLLSPLGQDVAGRGYLEAFIGIVAISLSRDGSLAVLRADGSEAHGHLGRDAFAPSSTIATSTYLPAAWRLYLQTTRGHFIAVELPDPSELAPVAGRPVIYLDQNHWSTVSHAIHRPSRVRDGDELTAAMRLIELATARAVILPVSAGHMSETCKQFEFEERYERALTMGQLSAGWQLRDPLELRRFELRQALSIRYRQLCLFQPAAVTLEPGAAHGEREVSQYDAGSDLPAELRWIVHTLASVGGTFDTMLDEEHVPVDPPEGWAQQFERFAKFLADNPTGPEVKRSRTHAKFIADLGRELPEEARRACITPERMSDWVLHHSETDLRELPVLGLYREVLHEKLCNPTLRWKPNDLTDMMYLTAAGGHSDYVVAERSHAAHLVSGLRRLGRTTPSVSRNLRELMAKLSLSRKEG